MVTSSRYTILVGLLRQCVRFSYKPLRRPRLYRAMSDMTGNKGYDVTSRCCAAPHREVIKQQNWKGSEVR